MGLCNCSSMAQVLKVIDLARLLVDEINAFADKARPRLLYEIQLRNSAQSIAANIREAFGRRKGRERNQFLRYARGSAEETDEHWRANCGAKRVVERDYWRLHNRIALIKKMLIALSDD